MMLRFWRRRREPLPPRHDPFLVAYGHALCLGSLHSERCLVKDWNPPPPDTSDDVATV